VTRLRVGVIGAGHLGRFHAKLLAEMAAIELVGVVDPSADARDRVAVELSVPVFAQHRDLLEFQSLDAAVVATPTKYHTAVAGDLMRRGIHVLVEKPLAATLAEAEELVAIGRRSGVVLQVGHIERFNPAFLAARSAVGEPKFIEATRAGSFTFRSTDIGVVHDLMIHDIDLVLSMTQSSVTNVDALGLALLGKHEDIAHARLSMANGCVANLSASRVSQAPDRQMRIWTTSGQAAIDFVNRQVSITEPSPTLRTGQIDVESLDAVKREELKQNLYSEHLPTRQIEIESRNALADELADFVQAIATGSEPRVTGSQARDAPAVADQILRQIAAHAWNGDTAGPIGSRPFAQPSILQGPHWHKSAAAAPRPTDSGSAAA
jgi:predicted dehydrogenase